MLSIDPFPTSPQTPLFDATFLKCRKTLREIQRLCDTIDQVVRTAASDPASKERYERLSLDVAILEGAEVDPARHDHCGALYPVNALRNLALLQVRKVAGRFALAALCPKPSRTRRE